MNIDKNNINLSSMTKLLMMSTLCNGSVTRQGRINNRQMTLGKWQWVSPKLTQNTKEQRVNREVTEGNTQNLIDKGLPPSRQPTGYRRTWDWPLVTTNWKAWPPWPYKGIWNKEAVLKNRVTWTDLCHTFYVRRLTSIIYCSHHHQMYLRDLQFPTVVLLWKKCQNFLIFI